ncbi:MAG TPA: molybdopterin cofactor-binding domain-containing protein, partial [Ohtaekwangia sp.]|uniref:xanthine dehydrogenase family protein molybdopterin-binding subunit n=1 Tax=Ohtaekwangia sp. TaxID=2066019 RepID=UPI002F94716A
MEQRSMDRRHFIKTSVLAGGGLILSFTVTGKRMPAPQLPTAVAMNAFLRIAPDNGIYIVLSKVEMGQGIWTTLPMLIAEELDCDWKKIHVEHRPSGRGKDFEESMFVQSTGGSDSTRSEFDRYRIAGATARTLLVQAAAARLGISPEDCHTEDGYIIAGTNRIAYGDVAVEASKLSVPSSVKLREPGQWKYIGKSQKRLDAPEKTNGKALYGIDIQLPGLCTALVARSPVFGGTVKSFDATQAKAIKGVRDVVQIPTGIAVVADHYWAAKLGREALHIEWNIPADSRIDSHIQLEGYRKLAESQGMITQEKGNVANALDHSTDILEADIAVPYLAHTPMEPVNCTVRINEYTCEVWAGTQSPVLHQQEVASYLGLDPEKVIFHIPFLGGSFGRRGTFKNDYVIEAVYIAQATGKPVKLLWTREDDIQGGYYRPVYLHRVRIGIDVTGYPVAWHHRIAGQSLFVNTVLEKDIAPNGLDYSSVDGTQGSPYLAAIPDHAIELHTTTCAVPVLPWRSVGNTHTAFVMETLVDELASRAGIDPVEYRRTLLKDHPRHLAAMNLAAEKAAWNKPLPAGHFRGIAVHAAMGSYVAHVIELSLDQKKIQLHRVVCAIDCGLAVNPDGVRAQMESCIVYALTAALYGEITLQDGRVQQSNFHNYKMLRISEMPR